MFLVLYCADYGNGQHSDPDSLHRTREGALGKIRDECNTNRGSISDLPDFDPEDTGTWKLSNHTWFEIKEMTVEE